MSQKSSAPQLPNSVSQALNRDTAKAVRLLSGDAGFDVAAPFIVDGGADARCGNGGHIVRLIITLRCTGSVDRMKGDA